MKDMEKLNKWKLYLNKCIRCGYCFEHCQIFKSTRWDSDSPRGKLTMLYGLLSGDLEPSSYIAAKYFECFQCNRCQKTCSSGVPVQEIYQDARAFLREAGYDIPGTTSRTDHEACALCLACVRMCKHEARSYVSGRIIVDPLKCRSCGNCLEVCPVKGIGVEHGYGTNPDELKEEISKFFSNPEITKAKAVIFSCGWSSYPGLQNTRYDRLDETPEYIFLVTACAGRLTSETVLLALNAGAWGVLICGCPEDECEHGGSVRTKARMKRLTASLENMGADPGRVEVVEIAQKDSAKFIQVSNDFMEKIRLLGPLLPGERRDSESSLQGEGGLS